MGRAVGVPPRPTAPLRTSPSGAVIQHEPPCRRTPQSWWRRCLRTGKIAERLLVTESTAAAHVEHMLGKLGIGSRAQIAAWAFERGVHTTRTTSRRRRFRGGGLVDLPNSHPRCRDWQSSQ